MDFFSGLLTCGVELVADTSVFLTDTDGLLPYLAPVFSVFAVTWLLHVENMKLESFLVFAWLTINPVKKLNGGKET